MLASHLKFLMPTELKHLLRELAVAPVHQKQRRPACWVRNFHLSVMTSRSFSAVLFLFSTSSAHTASPPAIGHHSKVRSPQPLGRPQDWAGLSGDAFSADV